MKKAMKDLMNVDLEFCRQSQSNGKEAWRNFLSKKAVLGTSKHESYIEGASKIVNLIGMIYALDNIYFTWEPVYAFVSDDETLGVTTGTYKRTYKIADNEYSEIGKYITTWTKEHGEWKIIFDIGN